MPTTPATYEDANLILRLYELRREEKLRQAREWFAVNFKVKSPEELMQASRWEAKRTLTCEWW